MSEPLAIPCTTFLEGVCAVNQLNSWVRSESHRAGFFTNTVYVVYFLKRAAIAEAHRLGLASHRRVDVRVKCRDCAGTGRYVNICGDEYDHCRACANTGQAHLTFVETTIAGQLRWHSPANWRRGSFDTKLWDWTKREERWVSDWRPNEPGRDLPVDEAARLLNLAEERIPHERHAWRSVGYDYDWSEVDDLATYRLYIGKTDKERCHLCGSAGPMYDCGHMCHKGRVQWSGYVCKQCEAAAKTVAPTAIFTQLQLAGPPSELLTPNVVEWILRHQAPPKKERVCA